jgi:hypothetical protein
MGLILPSATFHFVGWVEPISGYVGFLRLRQTNLHVVSSIAQCETQQWPVLKTKSEKVNTVIWKEKVVLVVGAASILCNTYDPNIPLFHYSNCERSELISIWHAWVDIDVQLLYKVENSC